MDKVLESNAVGSNISISRLIRLRGDKAKETIGQASDEDALAYLAELFRGNGWTVAIHSPATRNRALLLSNPRQPDNIVLIVRLLLNSTSVSYDEAKHHLTNLEEILNPLYACSQFCLIALNGFEAKAERLENYNLLLQDWSSIEELLENYSKDNVKEPRIQLFAHNKQSYKKVQRMMKQSSSVAVVQATGTGKSYLIAKLLQDFAGERKLVMAPSYYIIEQIKEHIRWEIDNIEFMTYAKSMNLSQAEIQELKPKMIVLDEFHRCGAEEWGRGVQNILNSYPSVFKFGTSATPVRYLDNGRDMSLELFNGHVAENLSLAQAIVRNILPMPKYVCALYTLAEEVSSLRAKIAGSRKNEETKKRLLLELDSFSIDWERSRGIPHVLKKHLGKSMRKFIIFCKDEEHLLEMEPMVVKWFKEATDGMPAKTYRVYDGEAKSDENLEAFKGDTSKDHLHLLFSINMLNEGLHVNEVSGVVLLRPTESPNIFYQQIGRCLKVGLSHRPVIFDFVNNFKAIRTHDFLYDLDMARRDYLTRRNEDLLDDRCPKFNVNDEVREITEVFGEIKFKLDNWEEMFEQLVAYKNKHGNLDINKRLSDENEKLFNWLLDQRRRYYYNKLNENQVKRLSELGVEWTFSPGMNPDESWEQGYQSLKKYMETYGHDVFSAKETPVLCRWVRAQRQAFKKGKLAEAKIDRLKRLGFHFDASEAIWENNFRGLQQFKRAHRHCHITKKDDLVLNGWSQKQRGMYRKGILSKERIDKLKEIGFSFDPVDDFWDENYNMLIAYIKEYGNFNVKKARNSPLHSWLSNQRFYYFQGELSAERYKRLSAIGVRFVRKADAREELWNKYFELLQKYKREHGNTVLPSKGGDPLYNWILRQRKDKREGKLSKEKYDKLIALGVNFESIDDVWEKQFNRYKELISKQSPDGEKKADQNLLNWANTQRENSRKGILSKEKTGKLKAIGFSFNPLEDNWENNYNLLVDYKKKHGDSNVPNNDRQFSDLKNWINKQRHDYNQGRISESRLNKLLEVGVVFEPEKAAWEKKFKELTEYRKKYGHCNVSPQENKPLNHWINNQRGIYRSGKMPTERVDKLNSIGFEFVPRDLDAMWQQRFDELVAYQKQHGHIEIPETENRDLNFWIQRQRTRYKKGVLESGRIKKLEGIGFKWSAGNTKKFDKKFIAMLKYKKEHSHVFFPQNHPLNIWADRLRKLYKENKLTKEQIQKLNDIGFSFNYQKGLTLHRVNRIQEAERFYKKYGHVNATLHHKDFPKLINWITNIRKQYKEGILPQELIEKFNGMGMDWHYNENRKKNNWDKRYAELLNYYNQHGTTVFPLRDSGVSEELRTWCGTQKKAYKRGKISAERLNKLNKIKFEWDDHKDAVWEENFARFVEFKKTHGHRRIPQNEKYKKLNTWCLNVRKSYKDGILTDERKQRLDAAGFSWDVHEDEWQRMYNELVKYKKRFGDLSVPFSQHEFKQLYTWVAQQRKSYKKKTVSPEHIQKLNALGFVWQPGIR